MGDGIGDKDIVGNAVKTFPRGLKPGIRHIPEGLEVGARILFRGFLKDANHINQFPIEVGDKEYCFLHMGSALAILDEEAQVGHLVPALGEGDDEDCHPDES